MGETLVLTTPERWRAETSADTFKADPSTLAVRLVSHFLVAPENEWAWSKPE